MPTAASGDDWVGISNGGSLVGDVVETQMGSRKLTTVRLDDDLMIAVPASRARQRVTSESLVDYVKRSDAAMLEPQANEEIAKWIQTERIIRVGLDLYRNFHYRRILHSQPDHRVARASLGYIKNEGQWVQSEDVMKRRGMVKSGSKWQTPEVAMAEESAREHDIAAKRLRNEIKTWMRSIQTPETWAKFEQLDDPDATMAWIEIFNSPRPSKNLNASGTRRLRMLMLDKLAKVGGSAVPVLVRAGLDHPDGQIREAALDRLQQSPFMASSARSTYLGRLDPKFSPEDINQAARALSWFVQPEDAMQYVDALVTTHKLRQQVGGNSYGFSSAGGGMSQGSKIVETERKSVNRAVLTLLKELEPDANYGFDQEQWRMHFIRKFSAYQGDLRRDP
ncbi:MAG: hypothetical protein AAF958_09900 [Planctomycetota bacterium]